MSSPALTRPAAVRRGKRLEYVTIAWNSLEALASIAAGVVAGSVSLVGFGLDSLIEVTSGAALLWRLHGDRDPEHREAAERISLKIVGGCFVALAAYVLTDSSLSLIRHEAPDESIPGIVIAALSLVAMPLLARAKRRVAESLSSGAMRADARQTDFCMYLSAILLSGLLLNALLGWWWADPLAGIVMTPIIAREGIGALRGKACCDSCQSGPACAR
jgi:divalent metal cation (Fe/Co/Zn/Cd) transporter